jgi:hypothetical protein
MHRRLLIFRIYTPARHLVFAGCFNDRQCLLEILVFANYYIISITIYTFYRLLCLLKGAEKVLSGD